MYKRRIKVFVALVIAMMTVVVLRLGYLQIVRGEHYRRQAEDSLQSIRLLPSRRGSILDRTGRYVLAKDEATQDFCLDYRFLTGEENYARRHILRIARAEGLTVEQAGRIYDQRAQATWRVAEDTARRHGQQLEDTVRSIRERVRRLREGRDFDVREQRMSHPVVAGLTPEAAVELMPQLEALVGASLEPSHRRVYPYGALACHVVGLTGRVWKEDQDAHNLPADEADWLTRKRTDYLNSDRIGRRGVEAMCEEILRGRRGYRRLKAGVGDPEVLEEVPAEHGRDVHLTLDLQLQEFATKLLEKHGYTGAAVVLDVELGEVLALVSVPTFDLNRYQEDYELLSTNLIDLPLWHRAVAFRYPVGSTAKPITMLAGQASGKVTRHTTFHCQGYLHNPSSFKCWIWKYRVGHGTLNMVEALKDSCNVYCYHVGNLVGLDYLASWFRKFGYGEKCGSGLPDERAGLAPDEAWLREHRNRNEVPADARFMSIGQGIMEATPLHVANAMATIARRGKHLSPVAVLEGGPPRQVRDLGIPPEHMAAVWEGMFRVVNDSSGTAYKPFHQGVEPLPFQLYGKTGTAQCAPLRVDGRVVRSGDMAWFAGFAPRDKPKVAFAVVVEYVEEGSGAKTAAPLAREILRACHRLGTIE